MKTVKTLVHAPNVLIAIVSILFLGLAKVLGVNLPTSAALSLGAVAAALVWNNSKLGVNVLHKGNFWAAVVYAVAYVLAQGLGLKIPSGAMMATATTLIGFIFGNTQVTLTRMAATHAAPGVVPPPSR